jgi:hypothetical protein
MHFFNNNGDEYGIFIIYCSFNNSPIGHPMGEIDKYNEINETTERGSYRYRQYALAFL